MFGWLNAVLAKLPAIPHDVVTVLSLGAAVYFFAKGNTELALGSLSVGGYAAWNGQQSRSTNATKQIPKA